MPYYNINIMYLLYNTKYYNNHILLYSIVGIIPYNNPYNGLYNIIYINSDLYYCKATAAASFVWNLAGKMYLL